MELEINDQAMKLIGALSGVLTGNFDGAGLVKVLGEMKAGLDADAKAAAAKA